MFCQPRFEGTMMDPLNYNSSEYEDDYEYDEDTDLRKSLNIMSLIVYSLAFVLGVVGNGIVIWVTGFKMKRTVNTVWFLNLAVADFLFTAFLPLSVSYTAMDFHWPFGQFMCKFNSTLGFLNMFASVYILVVISIDRCVSVVRRSGHKTIGMWAELLWWALEFGYSPWCWVHPTLSSRTLRPTTVTQT